MLAMSGTLGFVKFSKISFLKHYTVQCTSVTYKQAKTVSQKHFRFPKVIRLLSLNFAYPRSQRQRVHRDLAVGNPLFSNGDILTYLLCRVSTFRIALKLNILLLFTH